MPKPIPRDIDRRTVLKTLGVGITGAAAFSSSATAADHDLTIKLVGDAFDFSPRRASIDISDGPKTVRWKYVTQGGPSHHHDVTLAESNSLNTVHAASADLTTTGEIYDVEFSEDNGDLKIEESGGDTGSVETTTLDGALSDGSKTIAYVCSYHAVAMWGKLTVKG